MPADIDFDDPLWADHIEPAGQALTHHDSQLLDDVVPMSFRDMWMLLDDPVAMILRFSLGA